MALQGLDAMLQKTFSPAFIVLIPEQIQNKIANAGIITESFAKW